MHVIIDICIVPIGIGVSLSQYIAACEDILDQPGLSISLHPNGTAVEGEWETVMAAVKACHEKVHAMGAPRIHTTMKIDTRTDREQSMADKVKSVEGKRGG